MQIQSLLLPSPAELHGTGGEREGERMVGGEIEPFHYQLLRRAEPGQD